MGQAPSAWRWLTSGLWTRETGRKNLLWVCLHQSSHLSPLTALPSALWTWWNHLLPENNKIHNWSAVHSCPLTCILHPGVPEEGPAGVNGCCLGISGFQEQRRHPQSLKGFLVSFPCSLLLLIQDCFFSLQEEVFSSVVFSANHTSFGSRT